MQEITKVYDKIEKLTEERVATFKKKVLPKLQNLIDARDKALEGFRKANRLNQIDEEIIGLNSKAESLRESAALSENHDSAIGEIVNIRQRIETLKEVREEIENKILPVAERHLADANNALSRAAEEAIQEMAIAEKATINEQYIDLVAKIHSHRDGVISFGRNVLGLPLQHNMGCYTEFMLSHNGIATNFDGVFRL